jgi:hypothetical protein
MDQYNIKWHVSRLLQRQSKALKHLSRDIESRKTHCDVFLYFFYCPVKAEDLITADPPPKEGYKNVWKRLIVLELLSGFEHVSQGLIHDNWRKYLMYICILVFSSYLSKI